MIGMGVRTTENEFLHLEGLKPVKERLALKLDGRAAAISAKIYDVGDFSCTVDCNARLAGSA
jgi:FKBP-type peptidyl-prolyl cis-trans isomerase 2